MRCSANARPIHSINVVAVDFVETIDRSIDRAAAPLSGVPPTRQLEHEPIAEDILSGLDADGLDHGFGLSHE
jgi:hypothetical protein